MSTKRTISAKSEELQGFAKVIDPLESRRLIERAIEGQVNIDVRIVNPEMRFSARMHEESSAKESLKVAIPMADAKKLEALGASGPAECMIIAFLRGQTLLCIRSTNCSWSNGMLVVPPPWDMFKHQRRKEPRFEIPTAYELFVTLDAIEGASRRVQKKLIDISSSGLSFQILSPREGALYKTGLFLKGMKVTIDGKDVLLDGQVRNVLPVNEHPTLTGMKVGVQFVRVNPADSRYITAYVARNLAQFNF